MPWEEKRPTLPRPERPRELLPEAQLSVQVLAAFQAAGLRGLLTPGRRPAASALGWSLPAHQAGRPAPLEEEFPDLENLQPIWISEMVRYKPKSTYLLTNVIVAPARRIRRISSPEDVPSHHLLSGRVASPN